MNNIIENKYRIPVTKLPLESVTGSTDCVTEFPLESDFIKNCITLKDSNQICKPLILNPY